MQSEKNIPEQLSTEQQLLTDGRQWVKRAVDLYTQTSKIKVWVPFLASCLMTGYYFYNLHAKAAAAVPDPPAVVEATAPVAVAEIAPLPKAPAFTPSDQPLAPSDATANDTGDLDLRKRAGQAHAGRQFGEEAKLLQQFADHSSAPQLVCPAIGTAYERAGEIDSAVQAFERCTSLQPENIDTQLAFAHVLQMKQDFKGAATLYRQSLSKDPANLDAQTGLALNELKQNHLPEADEAVRAILHKAPTNTDALLIAGVVAWRQSRLADAQRIFLKGVTLDDCRADFHAFLGRIAEAQRRPQDALRSYNRALVLDPSDSDIADRRDRLRDVR